ncbi:MAG: hypothetical protein HY360_24955 [Verrucomicrobia bacterium]|nr:hypothetical protein [Verrucomicrobiota bacterium]
MTNGLGNFDIPIAEWNIMMMLWWRRNMLDAQASQRAILSSGGKNRACQKREQALCYGNGHLPASNRAYASLFNRKEIT